eukprot:5878204-Prymnesium_polylepis.1
MPAPAPQIRPSIVLWCSMALYSRGRSRPHSGRDEGPKTPKAPNNTFFDSTPGAGGDSEVLFMALLLDRKKASVSDLEKWAKT